MGPKWFENGPMGSGIVRWDLVQVSLDKLPGWTNVALQHHVRMPATLLTNGRELLGRNVGFALGKQLNALKVGLNGPC